MTHTYLVGLKPGVDSARVEEVGGLSTTDYDELDFEEHGKGRTVRIEADEDTAERLRDDPDVEYVEEDRHDMEILGQPSVGSEPHSLDEQKPWGITRTRADEVQAVTGEGVHVAVIDTGIDPNHPDLQENVMGGYAAVPCSGDCAKPWDDDNGHGTHVAGTIAAVDNDEGVIGVAPHAFLHAVKVLDAGGGGSFSGVADGIREAADRGWDVINMSLGSSSDSSTVRRAVEYAAEAGLVIVCAAGNSGPDDDTVSYPAAYPECIAVAASNSDDGIASFSSRGPEVEVTAPGVNVLSTVPNGDYREHDGTSMASPHVAGEAALLVANETLGVRGAIRATAEDLGHPETAQGNGLIDCKEAVDHNEPLEARITDAPTQVQVGDTVQVDIEVTSTTDRTISEHFNLLLVNGREEGVDEGDIIQDIDPGEWVPHTFEGDIPNVPEKDYRWRVTDNDGTPLVHADVTVGDGGGGDENLRAHVEVRLVPKDDGGGDEPPGEEYPKITFQVWNDNTDGAVEGATVQVNSADGTERLQGPTNSDGWVEFNGVPSDKTYNWLVSKEGYQPDSGEVPEFTPE